LNSIFLSLDKQYDVLFLRELFKLNLNGNMPIPYLLNKTVDLIHKIFDINMFDTSQKYIAVTMDYNKLVGYDHFLN